MKSSLFVCRSSAHLVLVLVALGCSTLPVVKAAAQKPPTKAVVIVNDQRTIEAFQARAHAFVKLRNRVRTGLPKLSKQSTAEQIATHKKSFEEAVRKARLGAKPGDIFTPHTAEYIRKLIRTEFTGPERGEVKKAILESETSGVPLRVNYPYPETIEFSDVPPTLLLKLPLLPQELNYRFVGRHMLLVDKENGLILDYMLNALP